MQMTISTTGRRRLCILCSVYVLSKMLKLCGAEGSSFSWLMGAVSCCCWDLSDFVSEVNLVAEQRLVCVGLHQIDPLWCCCQIFLLRSIKLCFWGGSHCCVQMLVSEVAYCLIQQLVVWSLDAVNSLLLYQRPGVVHQTHWLLGFVRVFGSECPALRSIRSWFLRWISFSPSVGCSASMLSVLRWDMSDGELAVARTVCVVRIFWRDLLRYLTDQNVSELLCPVLRSIRFCFLRWISLR